MKFMNRISKKIKDLTLKRQWLGLRTPLMSVFLTVLLLGTVACGGRGDGNGSLPPEFESRTDADKVAYMMKQASPDSVARFICNAALGRVPGARIDSINMATLYAYENYKDSTLVAFSEEFDRYSSALPLADKMRIYAMAGTVDPQGLGYQLGLDYMNDIRERKMSVQDIRAEQKAFKAACGADHDTYSRFLIGFKTVLRLDSVDRKHPDVYRAFINYDEANTEIPSAN